MDDGRCWVKQNWNKRCLLLSWAVQNLTFKSERNLPWSHLCTLEKPAVLSSIHRNLVEPPSSNKIFINLFPIPDYWGWSLSFEALKHLYSFKPGRLLLMYADLSRCPMAVVQALILQCNLMLQALRGWASDISKLYSRLQTLKYILNKLFLCGLLNWSIYALFEKMSKKSEDFFLPIFLITPSSCRIWKRWTFPPL